MKNSRVAFTGIFILLVAYQGFAGPISISNAMRQGWVKTKITGRSHDSLSADFSSYYGSCLLLDIKNISNKALSLELENGRFLETLDTNEQRMIVTRQELISLLPGKRKLIPVYAMCTQMHDHSPGEGSLLAMGPMAEGKLLQLTNFIGKNNYQDNCAQQAIWAVTDGNSLENLYSENQQELKSLQQFVSTLLGIPMPKETQRIEYAEGIVSGEIVFWNKKPDFYTMILENEAGDTNVSFFENKPIDQPIRTTLRWKFKYTGFPKGVYYVRLLTKNKEIISYRPVIIQ